MTPERAADLVAVLVMLLVVFIAFALLFGMVILMPSNVPPRRECAEENGRGNLGGPRSHIPSNGGKNA